MALANFVLSEMSPASPGTAVSLGSVQNASNYLMGGVAGPMGSYSAVDVVAELAGATGGSLAVYLQSSPDSGLSWYDLVAWPVIAAGASVKYYRSPISNSTSTSAPTVVGKNLSPLLLNTGLVNVVNGAFSDRMRLVMVAGAGTTAGVLVVVRLSAQGGN